MEAQDSADQVADTLQGEGVTLSQQQLRSLSVLLPNTIHSLVFTPSLLPPPTHPLFTPLNPPSLPLSLPSPSLPHR